MQKPKLLTIPGDPNSAMVDIGVHTIDEEESGDSNDSCGEIGVGTSPSSGTLGVSGQSTTDLKMSYTVWCGVCFFSITSQQRVSLNQPKQHLTVLILKYILVIIKKILSDTKKSGSIGKRTMSLT